MKKLTLFVAAVLLTVAVAVPNYAAEPEKKINVDLVVENLLIGLNSDNYGLKTSSAYLLGEFKSSKSVIPLMRMLHNENNENARIIAALSLYKIGNPIGVHAVKQAIRFDKSKRVRKFCEIFYYNFISDEVVLSNVNSYVKL